MTANEMTPALGQQVYLVLDRELRFLVEVLDVKFSWGKPRLQVTPIAGKGTRWVDLSSVQSLPWVSGTEQALATQEVR